MLQEHREADEHVWELDGVVNSKDRTWSCGRCRSKIFGGAEMPHPVQPILVHLDSQRSAYASCVQLREWRRHGT